MSFVSKLWNAIRRPVRYVGHDLQDINRPKRTVQYHDPEDMWKYVGGGKRLAVQWSAWLTHTRQNPPTIEELQADMMRQQRVLDNVALIEARDRAETEELLRIRQSDAAQALKESAMRNERLLPIPETSPSQLPAENVVAESAVSSESDPENNSIAAASTPGDAQANRVVLPPKFLTPTTSRKPRTTAQFSLPSSEFEDGVPSSGSQPEQSRTSDPKAESKEEPKSAPPPPWPSRPVSETESWTPMARRRG